MAIRVAKQPRLPSAYQEVEYIATPSNNSSYFETDMIGNDCKRVEFKIRVVTQPSTSRNYIYGCWVYPNANAHFVVNSNSTFKGEFNYGAYSGINTMPYSIGEDAEYVIKPDSRIVSINGNQLSLYWTTEGTYNVTTKWRIFAVNGISGINYPMTSHCRLYYFRTYPAENSNTPNYEFIPCYRKSDSVIGLYDTINNNFITPTGNDTFLMGRPINALPQGYQEVEYIQSSGTQYIDTNFIPSNTSKASLNYYLVQTTSDGNILGSQTSSYTNRFVIMQNATSQIGCRFGTTSYNPYSLSTGNHSATLDGKNLQFIYDGNITTLTSATFTSPSTMYICASNKQGVAENPSKIYVYTCSIYDNGSLVRNFIPCIQLSNNEVGMYDIVNGEFYGNASGTGVFTAGNPISYYHNINPVMFGINPNYRNLPSEYQQVEWIKANSNAYINTNVNAIAGYQIVTTIKSTSDSGEKPYFGLWYTDYQQGGHGWQIVAVGTNNYEADNSYSKITFTTTVSTEVSTATMLIRSGYSMPMWIFARNATVSSDIKYGNNYLYSCYIYDNNNNLIKDYVPCYRKSDNVIGLYDLINNEFKINVGSGTFTKGDNVSQGRNIKKVMLGVPNPEYRNVPSGFTQVEYIETSGSKYINTGIIADSNTRFELKDYYSGTNDQAIIGARLSIDYIVWDNTTPGDRTLTLKLGNTDVLAVSPIPIQPNVYKYYENNFYVNGTSYSVGSYSFNTNANLLIFAIATNDSRFFVGKLYYLKIWNNTTLVRDFVPCLDSNNNACLYDFVSNSAFYPNTGSFTYGNIVPQFIGKRIFPEKMYLYKDGDECTNVTGGWTTSSSVSATATKNPTNMYFSWNGGSNIYASGVNCTNTIDCSLYSKLYIDWACTGIYSSGRYYSIAVEDNGSAIISYKNTFSRRTDEYDISNKFTIKLTAGQYGATGYIYNIWLE